MASIFDSTDGREQRWVYARKNMNGGAMTPSLPALLGGFTAEARGPSIALNLSDYVRDPVLHSIVENAVVQILGTGLRLSSRPDAERLGLTRKQARTISNQIERHWGEFCTSADWTGRATLHELLAQAVRSIYLYGEAFALIETDRRRSDRFSTRVKLLDPTLVDTTKTIWSASERAVNGVAFDARGRWTGLWIRDIPMGGATVAPAPKFYSRFTHWNRPRIAWAGHFPDPRAVRGVPITAPALTAINERAAFQESVLESAMLRNSFAWTLETQLSPDKAVGSLGVAHMPGMDGATAAEADVARASYYEQYGAFLNSKARVAVLPTGDKLVANKIDGPAPSTGEFEKLLKHAAAASTGASFQDVSGDHSNLSFSAARFAVDLPWKFIERRREIWCATFFAPIYRCFVEELIASGALDIPDQAAGFWGNEDAWTACNWIGQPRPVADPLKETQSIAQRMSLGLMTFTQACAQLGYDAETQAEEIKSDQELLASLGLNQPLMPSVTTQQVRVTKDETAQPQRATPPARNNEDEELEEDDDNA